MLVVELVADREEFRGGESVNDGQKENYRCHEVERIGLDSSEKFLAERFHAFIAISLQGRGEGGSCLVGGIGGEGPRRAGEKQKQWENPTQEHRDGEIHGRRRISRNPKGGNS